MSKRRDKTTGLTLPSPVDPGLTTCVTIRIPNAPEYRQAFRGVVADLGKWWAWEHTEGQSDEPARQAAELWRRAATTITYADECGGGDMSCDDIADCIETSEAVQNALSQFVAGQPSQGYLSPPGQPMSDGVWGRNLTPSETCDPSVFWAQVGKFVDYLVTAGADFLEQLEIYTNAIEAAQQAEQIPAVGAVLDKTTTDEFLAFADWALETIQEAYLSADTQPNRIDLSCALFCAMKDGCELTLQGAFSVINQRMGGVFNPSELTDIESVINTATTLLTNPSLPLDTWIAFILAMGRALSYLGIQGIQQTLNIMLRIAADQPNDDWMVLCEDCAPDIEWEAYYPVVWNEPHDTLKGVVTDMGDGMYSMEAQFSYGAYRVGQMLKGGYCFRPIDLTYPPVEFPNSEPCGVGIIYNEPPVEGVCQKSILAASASPFTIYVTIELCT